MLTENASKIQQKYLGAKGLIVLIAVMNMFVPLSIVYICGHCRR